MRTSCHLCTYWTPETGCDHYLPDSETVLKAAGYTIYKPGIHTRQKKFILAKDHKTHRFETLARAAAVLIHNKK